jgi:dihydroorotate dehydrogenase (fumarate)
LAGADVVQVVSPLLRHGPSYLGTLLRGLEEWLDWNEMTSLGEIRRRASLQTTHDPAAFERAHNVRTLPGWTK